MTSANTPTGEQQPSTGGEPGQPRPTPISSVDECGLKLTAVRLVLLICNANEAAGRPPASAELDRDATLVGKSVTPDGFKALVSWAVKFPEDIQTLTLSGQHELAFSVDRVISEAHARYYAEVNSVILAYPYIRQLVYDLSAKSLGQNVMIRPLDVPAFVRKKTAEREQRAASKADTGGSADGTDATG